MEALICWATAVIFFTLCFGFCRSEINQEKQTELLTEILKQLLLRPKEF